MRAHEFIVESGGPQVSIRKIIPSGGQGLDKSAPWVKKQIKKSKDLRQALADASTTKEKFDIVYKIKSTSNKISLNDGRSGVGHVYRLINYDPSSGDLELEINRKKHVDHYRSNINDFEFQGPRRVSAGGSVSWVFTISNLEPTDSVNKPVKKIPRAKKTTVLTRLPW